MSHPCGRAEPWGRGGPCGGSAAAETDLSLDHPPWITHPMGHPETPIPKTAPRFARQGSGSVQTCAPVAALQGAVPCLFSLKGCSGYCLIFSPELRVTLHHSLRPNSQIRHGHDLPVPLERRLGPDCRQRLGSVDMRTVGQWPARESECDGSLALTLGAMCSKFNSVIS